MGVKDAKLSRREFIGSTAAGAAVLGAGALLGPRLTGATATPSTGPANLPSAVGKTLAPVPVPASWNSVADVVVVGLGGAGAAAAYMAAEAGAQVTVLEKLATPGGSTAMAYGAFAAAGTVLQTSRGIQDSPGKMYDFWMKAGQGVTDPDLTLSFCQNSADAWLWLAGIIGQQCGVTNVSQYPSLWSAPGFSGSPYVEASDVIPRFSTFNGSPTGSPTTLPAHGAGEFQAVYNTLQTNQNVKIMLNSPAEGLVTNNGEVVGVQALVNDALNYIEAKRAVVITTGSLGRNDTMSKDLSNFVYYAVKGDSPGNTGDGIRMGQQVGADLRGPIGSMSHPNVGETTNEFANTSTAIFVNNSGQRFVSEVAQRVPNSELQTWQQCSWTEYYAGFAEYSQDQSQSWAIMDSKGVGNYSNTTTYPQVVSAATITGLATALGLDPTTFQNTINVWNANAAKSTDPLYSRAVSFFQISTAPFYALPLTWTCDDAWGGLRINGQAQVLDTFGNPVPRLYAAGATTGGLIGWFYQHSGGAIGSAWTMGRIAGTNAAAEIPWE